ncbi:MAG: glutamate mutase L [Anaerolineae bacterium]|nr:glutamate mutase L [Anaerolineae bacterium]
MADPHKVESLLVADIGSVTTKVALVDVVNNQHRLLSLGVTATTTQASDTNVLAGVCDAIRQIQARTGRQLLTDDRQLITPEHSSLQGVDAFIATTSAAAPLRVAIVGLSRELSITSAQRAIHSAHAMTVATFALDESIGRWVPITVPPPPDSDSQTPRTVLEDPMVLAAETLARAQADAIVLVGGVDGGATAALYDLTNLVTAIVAARDEGARPPVIFAGNSAARAEVAQRIGQVTALRVVDNVRPTLDTENLLPLQHELEALYDEKKIKWLPGYTDLSNWTAMPIRSSAQAFQTAIRYLARRYGLRVMGVDLGASATSIVSVDGEQVQTILRADVGLGQHLANLLDRVPLERWLEWLPIEMADDEACAYWLNHTLYPRALPLTRPEMYLLQAAARVALASAAQDLATDECELLVLSGGMFASNSNLGALALVALDALQPYGVFSLAVDSFGLVPAWGALATLCPEAAASVLEHDGLATLGPVIALQSKNREGQLDARVRVQPSNSGPINLEVQHGSLELVPIVLGQKASLEVRLTGGASLPNAKRGVFQAQVEGGALGVVIDARGRPIVLPSDVEKRRTKIQQWYWDVGGEVGYA